MTKQHIERKIAHDRLDQINTDSTRVSCCGLIPYMYLSCVSHSQYPLRKKVKKKREKEEDEGKPIAGLKSEIEYES